ASHAWPRLAVRPALGLLLGILIGVVLFFARFPSPTTGGGAPPTGATPNVIGQDVSVAATALLQAGFRGPIPWTMDPQAKGKPCSVVSQQPPAGTSVQPGSAASLVIVSGNCAKKSD